MAEDFSGEVVRSIELLLSDQSIGQWIALENGVHISSVMAVGDQVEIVYERPELAFVVGLRVVAYPERGAEAEAARILVGNVNEPLGSFADDLEVDARGIRWWHGEPVEWWDRRA